MYKVNHILALLPHTSLTYAHEDAPGSLQSSCGFISRGAYRGHSSPGRPEHACYFSGTIRPSRVALHKYPLFDPATASNQLSVPPYILDNCMMVILYCSLGTKKTVCTPTRFVSRKQPSLTSKIREETFPIKFLSANATVTSSNPQVCRYVSLWLYHHTMWNVSAGHSIFQSKCQYVLAGLLTVNDPTIASLGLLTGEPFFLFAAQHSHKIYQYGCH